MMWVGITWGSANATAGPSTMDGQWVQQHGTDLHRVFPPRIRDDRFVEFGHAVNTDPATDTREG